MTQTTALKSLLSYSKFLFFWVYNNSNFISLLNTISFIKIFSYKIIFAYFILVLETSFIDERKMLLILSLSPYNICEEAGVSITLHLPTI